MAVYVVQPFVCVEAAYLCLLCLDRFNLQQRKDDTNIYIEECVLRNKKSCVSICYRVK